MDYSDYIVFTVVVDDIVRVTAATGGTWRPDGEGAFTVMYVTTHLLRGNSL